MIMHSLIGCYILVGGLHTNAVFYMQKNTSMLTPKIRASPCFIEKNISIKHISLKMKHRKIYMELYKTVESRPCTSSNG